MTSGATHAVAQHASFSLRTGAIAGIAGGLVIAALGMGLDSALGIGFWSLPNAIGGIALGAQTGATTQFGVVTLVGVVLHVVLSAGFGVATSWIARAITKELFVTSVAMGLALWVFNYYGVGSLHEGARAVARLNPMWAAIALHVVFGIVTALVVRQLSSRHEPS